MNELDVLFEDAKIVAGWLAVQRLDNVAGKVLAAAISRADVRELIQLWRYDDEEAHLFKAAANRVGWEPDIKRFDALGRGGRYVLLGWRKL